MHDCHESIKWRRRIFVGAAIPATFGTILFIIVNNVIFPKTLAHITRLYANEDGSLSMTTQMWAEFPADVVFNFYVWNITNADEMIYEGAMPRLQEHGPYAYIGGQIKENITWLSGGDEVSYRNRRFWRFSSDRSCATCAETDTFVVASTAYTALGYIVAHNDVSPALQMLLDSLILAAGATPVQTVTAEGFIFKSFDDPLVSLLNSQLIKKLTAPTEGKLFGIQLPEIHHAGLLPFYNNSYEPEYTVQTGMTNSDDVGKIVSYGPKKSMDWYMGDSAILNRSNDGTLNKHFMTHEDTLNIFISFVGRSFPLAFHEETTVQGVPVFEYRLERDAYDTNVDKNFGMRYANVEGVDYAPTWPRCPHDHVYRPNETRCDAVECTKERNFCDNCCNGSHYGPTVFTPPGFYPLRVLPGRLTRAPCAIFVSPPHMLWAPEQVSSSYAGQRPDEDRHRPFEWAVNPTLGSVVQANVRAQLNILQARGEMTQSLSLPNAIVPLLWVHIEARARKDIMGLVQLGGLYAPLFIKSALLINIFVLLFSLVALLTCKMHQRSRSSAPGVISEP